MLFNRPINVLVKQSSKYGPTVRAISTTQHCYRGKINIQRPRQPHYDRALFNAVTQPIVPQPTITQECYQKRVQKKFIDKSKAVNPYEVIIAREVLQKLNASKMVAIFHINSVGADEMFKVAVAMHKQKMSLKTYGKAILKRAVAGTQYETILPLFESNNRIVFCEEANIDQLLKIVKKAPQLILLAGIVDNRFLSKNEMIELSKLPDLTTARAQFVGVLNSVGSALAGNLQAHQTNLCNLLDVHAKSKDSEDDGATKSEDDGATKSNDDSVENT